MKISSLLLILILPLIGCQSLKRITDGRTTTPPSATNLPSDYYVTGTTANDYDKVIMPVQGRIITVEVKRSDENSYMILKDKTGYEEYAVFTIPRDGVRFTKRVKYFQGGGYTLSDEPAAPKGTEYRIHSVLK